MSLVVAVHFNNSIFEYFLPGLNNRAITVKIPAATSGYATDIPLSLEVWNGVWRINKNDSVNFIKSEKEKAFILLGKGLSINCEHNPSGHKFSIVVAENFDGYSDFDKYALRQGKITIGNLDVNSIQYDNKFVSDKHAIIETDANGVCKITDSSSNGTFVNDRKISDSQKLSFGDVIYIIGLKIVYLGDMLAINRPSDKIKLTGFTPYAFAPQNRLPVDKSRADEFYQRSPRRIEHLDNETVEIESPPNPNRGRRQPLIFTIGPSMTMVIPMTAGILFTMWSTQQSGNGMTSPFMFMGIITSVTASFIGVFWALANYRYSKKTEREDEARRCDLYHKYLDKTRRLLTQKHIDNKEILDKTYPETSDCLRFVKIKSRRLWERNVNHLDFLTVRLGIGEMPSPNEIIIPKERFSLIDDSLIEEPKNIKNEYKKLKKVPICISLRDHSLIGIIGEDFGACSNIARSMAIQIATYHSYTDVRMAFILSDKDRDSFEFAKWLPHTWAPDGSLRMMTYDHTGVGEVFYYLSSIVRERVEERENPTDRMRPLPHYIIFISDPSLVENEAFTKHLYTPTEQMGISTVLVYEQIDRLPNNCTVVIQNSVDYRGYYSLDSSFDGFADVSFDSIDSEQLKIYSRDLSAFRVRETQSAGAIPQLLAFLDMYKTSHVDEIGVARRWLENRTYESMRALIGFRGADAPLYLDIHEKYHGPHGLVAGTTGSGKSETLQTYILSLAVNYHPYEISFILIDYKGGGMSLGFVELPHVAGIITNLGGNQTNRALASINSEIKRRQVIFNEYKLKHIDEYIELFRAGKASSPMPHLLIIADEFAELKKEQPEFVRELVSASRVGRSLGVHLILATQKPSGVVDDEIWGNSKFRLCLRVQDKQDSTEMIRRPDAAYITNAGRGYFQVGNDEIFEAFQSGWSGAKYEPEIEFADSRQGEMDMINLWGKPQVVGGIKKVTKSDEGVKKQTQLEAVVLHISNIAKSQGIEPIDNIWLPPLPHQISLQELREHNAYTDGAWKGQSGELCPAVGIVDDPINQQQLVLTINFITEGHLLVSGAGLGGKTTFLQTLLYSLVTTYSPEQLNIYIADFGSRTMGVFGALPHVGGVVFDNEPDKSDKLISLLIKELNRRKTVFSEKGIGSIKEYSRICTDVPFIIVAIDNFASFMENCAKHEDNFVILSQQAASYGIYLVITCANSNEIRSKIRQNIGNGIGIQLADRFEYEEALRAKTDIVAEDRIPGRGLVCYPNPLEFQTALCLIERDAVALNIKLREQFECLNSMWTGKKAPLIPQIPDDISLDNLLRINEFKDIAGSTRHMPLGYNLAEARIECIDLSKAFCYSISGSSRSGKTNLLKVYIRLLKQNGNKVYLFDSQAGELDSYSRRIDADGYMSTSDELFDFMQAIIIPEFTRRNRLKAEFIKSGRKNIDKYIASEQKICLFINDMTSFCEAVYETERDMKGFMEQMVIRGEQHMIYLFACISPNDMSGEYASKRLMRGFIGWKEGIHLGGNTEGQRVFDFDIPVLERGKALPSGYGHTVIDGVTKRVITAFEE